MRVKEVLQPSLIELRSATPGEIDARQRMYASALFIDPLWPAVAATDSAHTRAPELFGIAPRSPEVVAELTSHCSDEGKVVQTFK
jgi:hypothetical protein